MEKVYIVTSGQYSDYGINAVFSSKEKAQEFIKNCEKIDNWIYRGLYYIEEWDLDKSIDIVDIISVNYTFKSPFSKTQYNEKIKIDIEKGVKGIEEENKLWGSDYEIISIRRFANPNRDIEEEKQRILKIAFDTATRIKYLYEVEKIQDINEIRKMIGG